MTNDVPLQDEELPILILDPKAPKGGASVFDKDTEEVASLHKDDTGGIIPDPGARQWKALVTPPALFHTRRPDPPGSLRLCKNDLCPNIVPPSKVNNVQKLFCNPICARRFHTRAWAKRNRSASGQWLETKEEFGKSKQVQFYRIRPKTAELAVARYKAHLQRGMCPNATDETNNKCPAYAYQDFYSKDRHCLAYATIVDYIK